MWNNQRLKSVKRLYEELILSYPVLFNAKEDYIFLLMAQSYQESGWNEKALSSTGCKGWAQFEMSSWKFVYQKLLKVKEPPNIWDVKAQIRAQDVYMKYLISFLYKKYPMLPRKEIIASALMSYNGGLELVNWCLEYHGVVSILALRDFRNTFKKSYPSEEKIKEILNYPVAILDIYKNIKDNYRLLIYNKEE